MTGGRWYVVPADASWGTYLSGIAITGAKTAWAGGSTLVRWDGAFWHLVAYPSESDASNLTGMAAGPDGAVWAVGYTQNAKTGTDTPLALHWNGKAWLKAPVSAPTGSSFVAVRFIPGGTAWAVGITGAGEPLVMHWSGKAWMAMRVPGSGLEDELAATARVMKNDAWAVGAAWTGTNWQTLILHWNGKTWS
jgi:hypothetical protein